MKTPTKSERIKQLKPFRVAIKEWKFNPSKFPKDERDQMKECYADDRAVLRQFAAAYLRGDFGSAYRKAYNMDTILRDMIPQDIWNTITNENQPF